MTFLSLSVCIIDEICAWFLRMEEIREGGIFVFQIWDIVKFPHYEPHPSPPKAEKPNYNFNVESVNLGQDLASELGKWGCLSPRPAWDISIPVGIVMCLFSADFVSLHKGQVKLF